MARPTEAEKDLIKQFRQRLTDVDLRPWQQEEQELLRWIRARRHNLDRAEEMLRKSLVWRKEFGVDDVLNWVPRQEIVDRWLGCLDGHDFDSSPVLINHAGKSKMKELMQMGLRDELLQYVIYSFELCLIDARQKRTRDGYPVTQLVLVSDYDEFPFSTLFVSGFTGFWLDLVKILEANYPESIKKIFTVNSNRINTILFNLAKPFMSDETRNKIQVYGRDDKEWKEALLKIIPADQLCPRYGGTKQCLLDFCCNQQEEPPSPQKDGVKSVVIGPREVLKIPVEVQAPGYVLQWSFKSVDYNIKFGLQFGQETLVNVKEVDSHLREIEGSHECEVAGVYTVVFDNTHSIIRSKKLKYKIEVQVSQDCSVIQLN